MPIINGLTTEDLETKGFLLKKDADAIAQYAYDNQVMVTFRNAGVATLAQLKKGAAAKGHDILAKTIKTKTLGLAPDASADELNKCLLKALNAPADSTYPVWQLIGGFVANWDKQKPTQLYLTSYGQMEGSEKGWDNNFFKDYTDKRKRKRKVISLDGALTFLITLAETYKDAFPRLFYTGDYDMHDLARISTSAPSIVPSDSGEETLIINGMNSCIYKNLENDNENASRFTSMGMTIKNTPRDEQEYQMIRHGAQVSYLAHMVGNEPLEATIFTLADKTRDNDEYLACYSKACGWAIIDPVTELNEWYKQNHVNLKFTWNDQVTLIEQIAKHISQQIYRFIQTYVDKSINSFTEDWIRGAVKVRLVASHEITDEITKKVIEVLTTGSGAVMRKIATGYELTIPRH